MSDVFPAAPKELLNPVIPQYVETFAMLLSTPSGQHDDDTAHVIHKEVISSLTTLLREFPKMMAGHLATVLQPIWNIVISSTNEYVCCEVNSLMGSAQMVDSDGECLGMEHVLFAVFEFIETLACSEHKKLHKLVATVMNDLVHLLVSYMQPTEQQSMVMEEGLTSLCLQAITMAISKHLQEAATIRASGNNNWWKLHEACMFLLKAFVGYLKGGKCSFDVAGFIQTVVLPGMSSNDHVLLVGRSLWASGQLAGFLQQDVLLQCLQACSSGLNQSQSSIVRVCAAMAAYNFCKELTAADNTALLSPYVDHMAQGLVTMATQFTEDVLTYTLESLIMILKVDPLLGGKYEAHLSPLTISLFLKYAHDPGQFPIVEDLFAVLSSTPSCQMQFSEKFLPTAMSILSSTESSQMPLGTVSAVLDILCKILQGLPAPLPTVYVTTLYPAVVSAVLRSDDSALLQSGGTCIQYYLSVAAQQLLEWHDQSGQSGLACAVSVVLHILLPSQSEYAASFVGRLIITLIKQLGTLLGAHLETILRAVLSKIQSVQTPTIVQSLLLTFIFLFQSSHLEEVITFLSGIPDITGNSSLQFVLTQWCHAHHDFMGQYDIKLSMVAMCQLLLYCVTNGNEDLCNIMVEGEEVRSHDLGGGVLTRSKKAQVQYTTIPLPSKLFKLLVKDLENTLEATQATGNHGNGDDGSDDSSEEEDGWEDLNDDITELLAPASSFPGFDMCDDDYDDDDQFKDDPISHIDVKVHLEQFFHQLILEYQYRPTQLTTLEQKTLITIGINC
ncbi:importin-9-like isoform X2 [Dysidea avara]|uniref:importin-9-like isoform X2 n=1 Tax=Dysidea avara TaxID=196820 RepID=UPI00331C83D9